MQKAQCLLLYHAKPRSNITCQSIRPRSSIVPSVFQWPTSPVCRYRKKRNLLRTLSKETPNQWIVLKFIQTNKCSEFTCSIKSHTIFIFFYVCCKIALSNFMTWRECRGHKTLKVLNLPSMMLLTYPLSWQIKEASACQIWTVYVTTTHLRHHANKLFNASILQH